ncbi:MAG TPA: hypothetical protein VFG30_35950 [Polyangiales bacterium]|jgi:hypothetical protein|nr:hypothetical protein [Polyangiales bacterium]
MSQRAGCLCLLLALAACAEGYASTSPEGMPAGDPPVAMGAPDFVGEACERGQRTTCPCPDGSEGMKLCTPDPKSPTLASFSSCLSCPEPPPMNPPQPAGMSGGMSSVGPDSDGDSDAAGRGGSGGRSSTGRGGAGAGGAAGRMSGSGRAGSTGGGSGRCNCTNVCIPVGIAACCRADGSCGCTWAPGAYCL